MTYDPSVQFSSFQAVFGEIRPNNRLVSPLGLASPQSGKYLIHGWYFKSQIVFSCRYDARILCSSIQLLKDVHHTGVFSMM